MEESELIAWRRALRRRLIEARDTLASEARQAASARILGFLDELFPRPVDGHLNFYWPFRAEFDARPFIETYVARGGRVSLPVVRGRGLPLEFRSWHPGCAMAEGVFGIPHPAEGPAVRPRALLVPLLGFDGAGYRLGYGGGYYDLTLADKGFRPFLVGVGFELGRVETIHPQPHDIPMDAIVTESGISNGIAAATPRP